MNDSKLQIVINAKDEASKVFDSMSGKMKKTADKMKGYGAGFTVMGAGITAVMGSTVKAYQKQETAEKRLEAISKKVTGSTDAEIEAFKKLATELQKVGVVGDEVLIMGQSQLASFTKSSEVVTELSDDLADLAVGQYGVNVSQEQAIQTANLMGKALSGQLGALTRTGILVSEELKVAFEECNTEEERAIVLSQIIQDNYGGLNEAMRDTSAGGMQDVINSLGDMSESIGKELIPIITQLLEEIKPIIEDTTAWMKENEELTKKIVIGIAAFGALMLVLGPLLILLPGIVTAVGLVITALGLILSPIGLVVLAIAAIIAMGYLLITHWDEVKETLIWTWEEIKKVVTEKIEGLQDSILIIWEAIKTGIVTKIEGLKESIKIIIEAIKTVITTKVTEIKTGVGIIWAGITTGITTKLTELKTSFKTIWDAIKNEIITPIVDGIKTKIEEIVGAVDRIITKFNEMIKKAKEALQKASIGGVGSWIGGGIQSGMSAVGLPTMNDFISRPGSAPVSFSPDDTIIGVKKPGMLGGGGMTVNVYEQGVYLSEDVAEEIGDKIIEKLKLQLRI